MYALLFFFCLTGQSGPSACGHVANNNNNNNYIYIGQSKWRRSRLLFRRLEIIFVVISPSLIRTKFDNKHVLIE